jgi:hypothetical protein
MLSGQIAVTGFLIPRHGRPVAPERVVAMAIFPIVLAMFAYDALTCDIATMASPKLPDIPDQAIALLTGSNILYISGKIARG